MTHLGTPQIDLFIAARAEHVQRKADAEPTHRLRYDSGIVVPRREGEHIKSIQSYAEDLWRRVYKRAIPMGDPLEDPEFKTFYKRVAKVFERSEYIENRGDVVTSGSRVHRHHHGRRLAPAPWVRRVAAGLPSMAPPGAVPSMAPSSFKLPVRASKFESYSGPSVEGVVAQYKSQYSTLRDSTSTRRENSIPREALRNGTLEKCAVEKGPPRDVMLEMERRVAEEEKLHREFTHAEVAGDYRKGRRVAEGRRYEMERSREADGWPHHVTVGRWREDEVSRRKETDLSVRIPWVIAEIDGRGKFSKKDRRASDRLARRLLNKLKDMGVDLSKVVVSYSGNASVHVRIPDGVFGTPIYRSEEAARTLLSGFFDDLCGQDKTLREAIDNAVLSPSHLIRTVGSVHEKTDRYTVATDGRTFLRKPPSFLWSLSEPQFRYSPFKLPLPRRAPFNEEVAELLYRAPKEQRPTDHPKEESAVQRIREGVERGENWGADVPGREHMSGRNCAALIWSHYAIGQKRTAEDAWQSVQSWNRKNGPPLPHSELRRVFEKAQVYQRENGRMRR